MKNLIVSYDLNGNVPTHAEMDKHIKAGCFQYARILETVWFVKTNYTAREMFEYMNSILSANDRLIVVEASDGIWRNLLINAQALEGAWNNNLAA